MWITQWSTGRLFNESTGRGQQLVACVWAGRIRPLVLGLPAPFLSCFPHLLTLPSSHQPHLPAENELLCPFRCCLSWSWAGAAAACWPASTRTQSELSCIPYFVGDRLPLQTSTSPQSPCAGRGKRKMSSAERDISRKLGLDQWETLTMEIQRLDCSQEQRNRTFHSQPNGCKMFLKDKNIQITCYFVVSHLYWINLEVLLPWTNNRL